MPIQRIPSSSSYIEKTKSLMMLVESCGSCLKETNSPLSRSIRFNPPPCVPTQNPPSLSSNTVLAKSLLRLEGSPGLFSNLVKLPASLSSMRFRPPPFVPAHSTPRESS